MFIKDFYAALANIQGAKAYPLTAPEGEPFPLIIYRQRSADWELELGSGQAIYSGQKKYVLDVECVGYDLATTKALLKTVIQTAMDNLTVTDVIEGPDAYDDDIKAYGSVVTLGFHARD